MHADVCCAQSFRNTQNTQLEDRQRKRESERERERVKERGRILCVYREREAAIREKEQWRLFPVDT